LQKVSGQWTTDSVSLPTNIVIDTGGAQIVVMKSNVVSWE